MFSVCNANDIYKSEGIQSSVISSNLSSSSFVVPKTSPMKVSDVFGVSYSDEYDGAYDSQGNKVAPPKNREYDIQIYELNEVDLNQIMEKRLGWRDCCQIVLTWNSISAQFSPELNHRITDWFWNTASDLSPRYNSATRCAAQAFKDVESSTPRRIKAVNAGGCHTPSAYATIFNAVKYTAERVARANCRRCCVTIDHEGECRGEMMITSDDSDPWYMDCSDAKSRFACKSNENGPPQCSNLDSVHDEL